MLLRLSPVDVRFSLAWLGGHVKSQHLVPCAYLKGTLVFISLYFFSFQMVDVEVLKKNENGLEVSILEDGGNVIAWLPTVHLSDFVANSKLLWHCLQEGDVLPRVMCLSDKGDRTVSFVISTNQMKKMEDKKKNLLGIWSICNEQNIC